MVSWKTETLTDFGTEMADLFCASSVASPLCPAVCLPLYPLQNVLAGQLQRQAPLTHGKVSYPAITAIFTGIWIVSTLLY